MFFQGLVYAYALTYAGAVDSFGHASRTEVDAGVATPRILTLLV